MKWGAIGGIVAAITFVLALSVVSAQVEFFDFRITEETDIFDLIFNNPWLTDFLQTVIYDSWIVENLTVLDTLWVTNTTVINATVINGTNLTASVNCTDIWGADSDFCNDATGGGNTTAEMSHAVNISGVNTSYGNFTNLYTNNLFSTSGQKRINFFDDGDNLTLNASDVEGNNYFGIQTDGAFFQLYSNPNPANDYLLATITEVQGADTFINFYEGGTTHNRFWNSGSTRLGGPAGYLCTDMPGTGGLVDCDTPATGADLVLQDEFALGGAIYVANGTANITDAGIFQGAGLDIEDQQATIPIATIRNTATGGNSKGMEIIMGSGATNPIPLNISSNGGSNTRLLVRNNGSIETDGNVDSDGDFIGTSVNTTQADISGTIYIGSTWCMREVDSLYLLITTDC